MQAISETLKNNVITLGNNKGNNVKTLNVNGHEVKRIAHYLVEKLDDQRSVDFFYKCAWRIPEHTLMLHLESAQRGRNPRRLFTWLCTQELNKLKAF